MFKKFRPAGRSGDSTKTPAGKETGPDRSLDASRLPSPGPDRAPPPRIELPRQGSAPSLTGGAKANAANPPHLKSVASSRALDRAPAQAESRPPTPPASRPVTPPLARPAAETRPSVPARPVIPPYPVPGARAKEQPSPGAEVQSFGGLMLVGPQIRLSAEIKACERLVVEGTVEGEVSETGRLEIARGGRFQGTARVDSCALAGDFEGDLEVRGVLSLKSNGRITGRVRYGEIEIERGGVIAGDFGASSGQGAAQDARSGNPGGPRRA